MGAAGAIEILNFKELSAITDPQKKSEYVAEKELEYREKFANPYQAAKFGFIDDIIEPRNTRFRIIRALTSLATKKDIRPSKKHNNIPL
jgi:acetyl-CoA carboxylase carboxyltransferase component